MSDVLLHMQGITKRFPGVLALDAVDFRMRPGEIHALMGENGAGKSTLVKVLTGVYRKDGGAVVMEGREIAPHSPRDAEQFGISTVYQEINLVPELSVAENICLGRQPGKPWFIRWGAVKARARAALARLGLDIDVTANLSSYSVAIQQLVAVARALDIDARLLILDEPTSSLDEKEVERLFDIMRKLRDQGLGIVFITHFLEQVYAVSDRITVLRDGHLVGEFATGDLPRLQLVGKMIGRDPEQVEAMESRRPPPESGGEPFIRARNLSRRGVVGPVDVDIPRKRIVGLAGLLGSGRTETVRLLFGIDRPDSGEIDVDGAKAAIRSPRHAIALGFAFTPEDRKVAGVIPGLSVRENIIVAMQARRGWLRRLPRKEQIRVADRFIEALRIKTPNREQAVGNLSGGNQQKVLLARWLALEPRLLLLDEPTRGIDVGAKADIESLVHRLCADGMSIVFVSSELEEVVRISHHLVVLRDRRKVGDLAGEEAALDRVMHMIAEHADG